MQTRLTFVSGVEMMRRTGFTLVEVMIVVTILGILGAIVLPVYQGHASEAKVSSAKSNLHAMRAQIELYKLQHEGVAPGYEMGMAAPVATLAMQFTGTTAIDGLASPSKVPSDPFLYGPYLMKFPENPLNNLDTIAYVAAATAFSAVANGGGAPSGWLYKKETGEIRLNYPGADSENVAYVNY
jgi:general secretion pathway protein G